MGEPDTMPVPVKSVTIFRRMQMKHILVTGGAGFIGSHLVDSLLKDDFNVVVLDDLSSGKMQNLPNDERLQFIQGDVADHLLIDKVFKEFTFSHIFHLAAIASVHESVTNTYRCHKVNCEASLYLLEKARKCTALKRMVYASSAAVYGDDPALPKSEDSPTRPISPYGIDKYTAEQYMLIYNRLYGVPAVALRYFNVYGPRQNGCSMDGGVVSIFLNKFLSAEKPVATIYGDGQQTRDFVYIKDVVNASRYVMTHETAAGNVYNVATGRETSILNVIQGLEEITGHKAQILFSDKRTGDIERSFADISRLRALGFVPRYSLLESLQEYVETSGEIERPEAR